MSARTLFDRPDLDHLELVLLHGQEYVAIGPAEGSKYGPAPHVVITGRTDRGYTTKRLNGAQAAAVIAFGCEHLWRPA